MRNLSYPPPNPGNAPNQPTNQRCHIPQAVSKNFQQALQQPAAHSLETWDQDEPLPLDPTQVGGGLSGAGASLISPKLLSALAGYKACRYASKPPFGQAWKGLAPSLVWLDTIPGLASLEITMQIGPFQNSREVRLETLPRGLVGVRKLYLNPGGSLSSVSVVGDLDLKAVFPKLEALILTCEEWEFAGGTLARDFARNLQVRIVASTL